MIRNFMRLVACVFDLLNIARQPVMVTVAWFPGWVR